MAAQMMEDSQTVYLSIHAHGIMPTFPKLLSVWRAMLYGAEAEYTMLLGGPINRNYNETTMKPERALKEEVRWTEVKLQFSSGVMILLDFATLDADQVMESEIKAAKEMMV
ncbi:hypothetical protein Tco_0926625 [Tanacetum coccineum]|uniref:Uncharacterized protein n=1 Tax=Tanacetum coccineum TaxID=301880 RepID=A0ABQ5DAC2_9ASTR